MDKHWEHLAKALDALEQENGCLAEGIESYKADLADPSTNNEDWHARFVACNEELNLLKTYLNDLRQAYSDERCAEWGHFVEEGACTDCGQEVGSS